MKPLKICMLSYSKYLYDGRIHRYSESLIRNGHQVDMIGLGFRRDTVMEIINGVRIFRIHPRDFSESGPLSYFRNLVLFCMKSFFFVTRMHLARRYDVIHFHNIPDFGVFATLLAKAMGAKIILDVHDLVPEFYMRKFNCTESHPVIRLLLLTERISCRFADHVITVTDLWKETLSNRSLTHDKCLVIMNLPVPSVFRPLPYNHRKADDPFRLSYHGNLAEQTGVDILIEAVAMLSKDISNLSLQIIGEGRMSQLLIEQVRQRGLTDRVTFLPVTPVTRLPERMSGVHAAVDPKKGGIYAGETLSVKAMECLGMQIPLIVSRTKASEFYFRKNEVCFFRPGNASDLARVILNLYTHEKVRQQLHKNAQQFNARFNWAMMQKRYFHLIHDLVKESV